VSRAASGRNDGLAPAVASSSLGLENLHVPNKVRNDRKRGLKLERCAAVRAIRACVEKGIDLLLEEVPLQGAQEVFGLRQGQPEMLDVLMVLVEVMTSVRSLHHPDRYT